MSLFVHPSAMAVAVVMSMGVVMITPMLVVVMIVVRWDTEIRLFVIVRFHVRELLRME
jgi:hypothetical protein